MTPDETRALLADLAHVKAIFQLRAIVAAMGVQPDTAIPCAPGMRANERTDR